MSDFKQYRRKELAELRRVTEVECANDTSLANVSISQADLDNGSPKFGDMVARNPKNHKDQWLVAEQYFKDNFEEL